MSDVKCGFKTCNEPGRWLPVLIIRPQASVYPNGIVPANAVSRGTAGMPLCDQHRAEANVDDFCTPEGFAQITRRFADMGLAAPDPDVGLDFDPLPACGAKQHDCQNPAVVQVVWTAPPPDKGASLVVCADHLADVRRVLLEHNPGEGVERQEVVLVPEELWR